MMILIIPMINRLLPPDLIDHHTLFCFKIPKSFSMKSICTQPEKSVQQNLSFIEISGDDDFQFKVEAILSVLAVHAIKTGTDKQSILPFLG